MAHTVKDAGRSVTGRALAVLATFDPSHRRLSLSEMARRASLPVPTAYRLVRELEEWQALERRPDGTYEIGSRLWNLGLLTRVHTDLREVALPQMQELCATTRAMVHLVVRDDTAGLCIDRLRGVRDLVGRARPGEPLPLHSTAVGKVLLAAAPVDVLRKVASEELRRFTPYTVVEPGRLLRDVAAVRSAGYALTCEETVLGALSVAAPIRQAGTDGVTAALGVVLPSSTRDPKRVLGALRAACEGIASRLEKLEEPHPTGSTLARHGSVRPASAAH